MTREDIILTLAELVKDEKARCEVAKRADKLFPYLEELLSYDVEMKVEDLILNYADANRRSGFLNGFNTAICILNGSEKLLLSADELEKLPV